MDHHRFDSLTRWLGAASSRRGLAQILAGGGLVALFGEHIAAHDVDAKNKKDRKKGKKKKPPFNDFGCLDVGKACGGNSGKCCSGICQGKKPRKGKKDKSRCVAHNAGICFADADSCAAGTDVPCNASNPSCFCVLTTGNAGFCAAFTGGPAGHCRVCSKDTDCQAEFGAGAACLVLGGICTPLCIATGRTACAPPCA